MSNSNEDPGVGKKLVTEGGPSRTALTAALMRAVHTRLDRPRLIDDPWADRLVSAAEKAALYRRILDGADPETRSRLERLGSQQAVIDAALRAHDTYGGVILRSRCAEDALERAVARGARQYVLVGAGFDSFIVRQPAFARDVDIYEIDHPASQAMKRQRLDECAVAVPPNVHFVPADLSRESLSSVLARCGFSGALPTFFSWLGVTIYLPREANLSTLHGVATSSSPGSEVVFTYTDQRVLDGGRSAKLEKMRRPGGAGRAVAVRVRPGDAGERVERTRPRAGRRSGQWRTEGALLRRANGRPLAREDRSYCPRRGRLRRGREGYRAFTEPVVRAAIEETVARPVRLQGSGSRARSAARSSSPKALACVSRPSRTSSGSRRSST